MAAKERKERKINVWCQVRLHFSIHLPRDNTAQRSACPMSGESGTNRLLFLLREALDQFDDVQRRRTYGQNLLESTVQQGVSATPTKRGAGEILGFPSRTVPDE